MFRIFGVALLMWGIASVAFAQNPMSATSPFQLLENGTRLRLTPAPGQVGELLEDLTNEPAQSHQSLQPLKSTQSPQSVIPNHSIFKLPSEDPLFKINSHQRDSVPPGIGQQPWSKHPEAASMNYRNLALPAVLGAAMFAMTPAHADDTKDLKDVKEAVTRLNDAIRKLEDTEKKLREQKEENTTALRSLEDKMRVLRTDIEMMRTDIQELRTKTSSAAVTTLKPDASSIYAPTAPSLIKNGKLRVINDFPEEMSIIVNGRSYRVYPGQDVTIPVPAGQFQYQVLQLQRSPQERLISAEETKTIRIYPTN